MYKDVYHSTVYNNIQISIKTDVVLKGGCKCVCMKDSSYRLNFVSSNSYVEALTLNMMVFGEGTFRGELGLDKVMRVVLP